VAAAWLIVAGSILIGVYRFWAAPPIFGYDPFVGYFPGSVYDENIALGPPFYWSRLYQTCFALCLLAGCAAVLDVETLATRRRVGSPGALAVGGLCAVATAILGTSSARLGFAVDADDIAEMLGGRYETEHFVIYHPEAGEIARRMAEIGRDHEFRYAQVVRAFGVEPAGKVTSFYFASAEEKQRWMGAGATYIAKPWRREIYVQHDEFPHDVLRHEIAHVVAGAFGDPLFHVSVAWIGWPPARFNVGLIEGAAVAADWPTRSGRMTPDQAARAMLDLGMLPPVGKLLAPGFLEFSSATSYTTAGSFCRFLLDRYGPERFRDLYRAGGPPRAFPALYGKPLVELEREWHERLRATPVADDDREVARERFRRPGIFKRPCPHAVARRLERAGELIGRGKPGEAVEVLRRVCADDPGEPTHRLSLATALIFNEREEEAVAIFREIADAADLSTPLRARALIALLDLHGRRGDVEAARRLLPRVLALPVDEGTRRGLVVRALALDPSFPGAAALRAYLFTDPELDREPDLAVMVARAHRVAAEAPTSGLGDYLMGRLISGRGAPVDALFHLARAQELGLPDLLIARENDRLLAAAAFQAADYERVRQVAARLQAPAQPLAVQLEGADWLERIRFAETGSLAAQ
jgi:hypothetical protein